MESRRNRLTKSPKVYLNRLGNTNLRIMFFWMERLKRKMMTRRPGTLKTFECRLIVGYCRSVWFNQGFCWDQKNSAITASTRAAHRWMRSAITPASCSSSRPFRYSYDAFAMPDVEGFEDMAFSIFFGKKVQNLVEHLHQKTIPDVPSFTNLCVFPRKMKTFYQQRQMPRLVQDKYHVYFLTEFLGGGDLFYAIRLIGVGSAQ